MHACMHETLQDLQLNQNVVVGGDVTDSSPLNLLSSSTPRTAAAMTMGEITRSTEAMIMKALVTFLQPWALS